MLPIDRGLLAPSKVFFHTASETARELFFYPLCTGRFFCDASYQVVRNCYDSFLVLYVANGRGYLECGGSRTTLPTGCVAMVDCYQPHAYGTDDGWEIYWLHFDGVLARRYFELCTRGGTVVASGLAQAPSHRLQSIYNSFAQQGKNNEAVLTRRITDLLTELMLCASLDRDQSKSMNAVEETLAFIAENVTQPLTLEQLAGQVALSPFYFLRLFKKETGFTPHEYVIRARVDKAKYLLKTTDKPLKEIAYSCGFSNECNFSSIFSKTSGSTPLAFRREVANGGRVGGYNSK